MKIGFSDIKKIFVTLPIGYYFGGRVPAVLEQHGHGTYYDMRKNEIHLDSEQIEKMCATLSDDSDAEMIVRSCLYHELSHAMLTPQFNLAPVPYILNVMEDERIETAMKDYFMGVDFFKNLTALNNWDGTCDNVPDSPTQAFYDIVRYHIAPPTKSGTRPTQLVTQAHDIIQAYIPVHSFFADNLTARSRENDFRVKSYITTIRNFYKIVKSYYPGDDEDNRNSQSANSADDSQSTTGDSQQMGATNSQPIGDKDEDYQPANKDTTEQQNNNDAKTGEVAYNAGGTDDTNAPSSRPRTILPHPMDAILTGIVHDMHYTTPTPNPRLENALDQIFTTVERKNHGGAALVGYSGVLNPRNCQRNDYRYWEKKATFRGSNQYGTVHLNLFIDVSGSMQGTSMECVNQLLEAMHKMIKRHRELSFSVLAMGDGQRFVNLRQEPYLSAEGGNDLNEEIFQQYRSMQKPNTAVYNLVIFDGIAYGCGKDKNFGAFDHANCTIISDKRNQSAIEHFAPHAKCIITDDYSKDFVTSVIKTLMVAFH